MSTEELSFRSILDDSLKVLIPAGVGLSAAACNYAFHWGYCEFFSIPPWYITFDTVSLFVRSVIGLAVVLTQSYLILQLANLSGSSRRGIAVVIACYLCATLLGVPFTMAVVMQIFLVPISHLAQNSRQFSGWISVILGLLAIGIFSSGMLLAAHHVDDGVRNSNEKIVVFGYTVFCVAWFIMLRFYWVSLEVQLKEGRDADPDDKSKSRMKLETSLEWFILAAGLVVAPLAFSYFAGDVYADSQTRFYTIDGFDDYIVVGKYGEATLLSKIVEVEGGFGVGDSHLMLSQEAVSGKNQTIKVIDSLARRPEISAKKTANE